MRIVVQDRAAMSTFTLLWLQGCARVKRRSIASIVKANANSATETAGRRSRLLNQEAVLAVDDQRPAPVTPL
jgi:hypothetical protein